MAPSPVTAMISRRLAERLGHRAYDMWFGNAARLNVDGSRMEVATNTRFAAAWIDANFHSVLDVVAREALGDGACVSVRVAPDLFTGASGEPAPAGAPGRAAGAGARDTAAAPPGPHGRGGRGTERLRRLEDFVVGASNRLAFEAATRLAEDPADSGAGGGAGGLTQLFLYGECGVGKTHLLQGTVVRYLQRHGRRGGAARYLHAEQFTGEYVQAVRANNAGRFQKKIRGLELLALDDIDFLANKAATQNEFLHTIDALTMGGARVVLASDEHPRRLGFTPALSSRLLAGTVARIELPDRDTRGRIVQRLAQARGLPAGEAAIGAIADRCLGSVRELEAVVNKQAALRRLGHQEAGEIGTLLIEQIFADSSWRPKAPLRIDAVIDEVCRRLGVTRTELMGSGRHRRLAAARGLVAFLARDLTTMSYPEIGAALGRRNHSTVHNAAQRLARLIKASARVPVSRDGTTAPLPDLLDQIRGEILRTVKSR